MTELKPCPFCGGEADTGITVRYASDDGWETYAGCAGEGCPVSPRATADGYEDAAAAWNTRPPMQEAAPNLYAALSEIVPEIEDAAVNDEADGLDALAANWRRLAKVARAALARARGETPDNQEPSHAE